MSRKPAEIHIVGDTRSWKSTMALLVKDALEGIGVRVVLTDIDSEKFDRKRQSQRARALATCRDLEAVQVKVVQTQRLPKEKA